MWRHLLKAPKRRLSTEAKNVAAVQVGDIIHGYKVEKIDFIQELNIKPYYLSHLGTGAEHLHIQHDGDTNNVFAVSLRTTPQNSTGVAHILEHLALCGSKKYAVRDPFMKMLTRSLATFMNAMTGPDYTVYPFSTQNRQDYENLLSVYLDSVFFPRLRPVDFRQEGWRLEYEQPHKEDTPIVIKGVVYNEMKGYFSSSAAIYCRQLLNYLYPDNTYQYESGGDPQDIPNLTHAELKKFHQTYYHPSNAKFFTYGDIPLETHLNKINELIMTKFTNNSYAREQSEVQEQQPWKTSKVVNISCPTDPLSADPNKQTTTSISYMIGDIRNVEETFLLSVLSSLLMDGPNSPFYQSLIESGLGSDYSPSSGFANYTKQPYFSIGLQGLSKTNIDNVQDIIQQTFEKVSKEGFASERIEAILHSIELGTKHISGNFGLRIAMSVNSLWNHNGDVISSLKVNEQVEIFKRHLQNDEHYLTKAIGKYFLNNPHKLILNMSPDDKYQENRANKEKVMLEEKISKLKDIDRKTILYEGMELVKIQSSKEDTSVLPCLSVSKDIPRGLKYKTNLLFDTHKGVNIQLCEQPTNEVVYFRTSTEVGSKLNDQLIDYLPLFCDVVTKLGAGKLDRKQFSQKIQLTTGGLGACILLNPSLHELDKFQQDILFSSRCLKRNVPKMFELWADIFNGVHFEDKDYLHQLIKVAASELAEGVSHNGKQYAVLRASSRLTRLSNLQERLSGLTHVAKVKDMAREPVNSIIEKLKALSDIVLDPYNLKCSINAEPVVIDQASRELKSFIDEIQRSPCSLPTRDLEQNSQIDDRSHVGWMVLPFATHFVGKALMSVPKMHKDFASLSILAKLVSSKFLLNEVREKGGAYGAGAIMSTTGTFQYFSYRDPQNLKTLDIFNKSVNWLLNDKNYTDQEIDESKLGVFQDVDKPIDPGSRGLSYFLTGESDDMKQEFRTNLLDVKKTDIAKVAAKYLEQDKFGAFILGPEPVSETLGKEEEEMVKKIEKVDLGL